MNLNVITADILPIAVTDAQTKPVIIAQSVPVCIAKQHIEQKKEKTLIADTTN